MQAAVVAVVNDDHRRAYGAPTANAVRPAPAIDSGRRLCAADQRTKNSTDAAPRDASAWIVNPAMNGLLLCALRPVQPGAPVSKG
jgi:hypothetical protein